MFVETVTTEKPTNLSFAALASAVSPVATVSGFESVAGAGSFSGAGAQLFTPSNKGMHGNLTSLREKKQIASIVILFRGSLCAIFM